MATRRALISLKNNFMNLSAVPIRSIHKGGDKSKAVPKVTHGQAPRVPAAMAMQSSFSDSGFLAVAAIGSLIYLVMLRRTMGSPTVYHGKFTPVTRIGKK
ncbi:hypothetical protein HDE_04907 [Halotydeus destructor]|nr:hypothetical protein HDE_04907 [Halotydeus destructor]